MFIIICNMLRAVDTHYQLVPFVIDIVDRSTRSQTTAVRGHRQENKIEIKNNYTHHVGLRYQHDISMLRCCTSTCIGSQYPKCRYQNYHKIK
jgi:hypothetical protein